MNTVLCPYYMKTFLFCVLLLSFYSRGQEIVTCEGMCGLQRELPCSCDPYCILYNNCCENFTIDCPHTIVEGQRLLGDLIHADIECTLYNVYTIVSCPDKTQENYGHTASYEEITTKREITESLKAGASNPRSLRRRKRYSQEAILTTVNWLYSVTLGGKKGNAPSISSVNPSTKPRNKRRTLGSDTQNDLKDATTVSNTFLSEVFEQAPVVDISTGLTYVNSSVFSCYAKQDSQVISWQASIVMSSIESTVEWQTLENLLEKSSVIYTPPEHVNESLKGRRCFHYAIDNCQGNTWWQKDYPGLDELCLTGPVSYVAWGWYSFKNRFCAQCVLGPEGKAKPMLGSVGGSKRNHDLHLSLLVSLYQNNFHIELESPKTNLKTQLPWKDASCRMTPSSDGKEDLVCEIKDCGDDAERNDEGICVSLQDNTVIVAHDGFPLTALEHRRLPEFIKCNYEKEFGLERQDYMVKTTVVSDVSMADPVYKVDIHGYMPVPLLTDQAKRNKWLKFSGMLKAFKIFRQDSPNDRVIRYTHRYLDLYDFVNDSSAWLDFAFRQNTRGFFDRGEVVDNMTTMICVLNIFHNLECSREPLYANDLDYVQSFQNSSCYDIFMESTADVKKYSWLLWTIAVIVLMK